MEGRPHGEAAQLQQMREKGEDATAQIAVRVLLRERQQEREETVLWMIGGWEAVERGERAGEERVGESDHDALLQREGNLG